MTFDSRPSVTNDQKRRFKDEIDRFTVRAASHAGINGDVLQAVEWLDEVGPGMRMVMIFADMEEDLTEGFVRDFPIESEGVRVIALNVTKLTQDNVDPRVYMGRLEDWRRRVEEGGGQWAVINDMERLDQALGL